MNNTIKLHHVIGLLAMVIGAVATLDTGLLPAIRYLAIYMSILAIAMTLLLSVYQSFDDDPSNPIKDNL
jgi:hypothetical protein